jgi:Arc/MetJ-type ribon-helix-helix transcriptional regulator
MTIHLPEDLVRFVQAKVQSGRFASEQDVVMQALRRLQNEEERTASNAGAPVPAATPAWQRVLQIMDKVPDSVLEKLPVDGSAQLDHYVYGTPKRPNP